MLKIAQSIDKEVIRAKKLWEEVDSDAGSEEVGIRVNTSKQTRRGPQQKFKDIARAQEAFPTLDDNNEEEEDDLMNDAGVPVGEINDE